jgi:predicted metal-dependent peptidase
MARRHKQQKNTEGDTAKKYYAEGWSLVRDHAIFGPLLHHASLHNSNEMHPCPKGGLAVVASNGYISVHVSRILTTKEWAYVLAHSLLHLAFGHFQEKYHTYWREWNAACDCCIAKFLADLRFGEPPLEYKGLLDDVRAAGFSIRTEEQLYDDFCIDGIPAHLFPTGTAGGEECDMHLIQEANFPVKKVDWQECFSQGLQMAVDNIISDIPDLTHTAAASENTLAYQARNWFISSYPLLGALAASFKINEDPLLCYRMNISIAAVDMEAKVIYINPQAGLSLTELRFVMAHELLHVGLRHDVRCDGRDHYLWNVACDYVINNWLVEMGIGHMPAIGGLFDQTLKDESAEAIYDRIVCDLRRYRKITTMRGTSVSDILGDPGWWANSAGADLDDFYRSCLSQGLQLHEQQGGRGYLSNSLIEEIRALSQPPVPWDVKLAQWFDYHFTSVEKVRSYARLSRRQDATPDIPRPLWVSPLQANEGRTFGVLLDTSGSMESSILAKALGAIASYSIAHEVPAARVIFCDVITYDQGYMPPEAIADKVKVRGRGGTILQPGIDLLEHTEDFPKEGPLLIITDGLCDKLAIHREHAFLLPIGHSLPFPPKGEIFRIS